MQLFQWPYPAMHCCPACKIKLATVICSARIIQESQGIPGFCAAVYVTVPSFLFPCFILNRHRLRRNRRPKIFGLFHEFIHFTFVGVSFFTSTDESLRRIRCSRKSWRPKGNKHFLALRFPKVCLSGSTGLGCRSVFFFPRPMQNGNAESGVRFSFRRINSSDFHW